MRHPPAVAAVGVVAGLAVVALTGCEPSGPTDEELGAAAADAKATVVAIADEAGDALESGAQVELVENTAAHQTRSWDCSDSPAATGEAVQWAADRQWSLESGESTMELLDPIVDHFVAEGWQVTEEDTDGRRFVRMDHDGYMLQLAGEPAARSGQTTQLDLGAYSPCLRAPAGSD